MDFSAWAGSMMDATASATPGLVSVFSAPGVTGQIARWSDLGYGTTMATSAGFRAPNVLLPQQDCRSMTRHHPPLRCPTVGFSGPWSRMSQRRRSLRC